MTEKQNWKAWIQGKWSELKSLRRGPWPEGEEHDKKRRLWAVGWLLLAVLLVEEISLVWTAGGYAGLTGSIWSSPPVLLLNLLPLLLLVGILYALIGRASLSLGISGGLVLLLTLINAFKLKFRGDPFQFSDIFLAEEAGEMAGRYTILFSAGQIIGLLLAILLVVLLVFFTGKLPLRGHWKARGITAGGCAAALVLLMVLVYPNQGLYKAVYAGGDSVSKRDAAQWYAAHGLTYSFLHSVIDQEQVEDMVGSTAETVEALEESDYVEPDDQPNVNIIAIQLEAYCDLSDYLDYEAVEEVYAPLHEIEEEAISGDLITNINGGGTINTERSVITGYTALPEFTEETNSYAWYLQSIGYTVEGSHPNGETFYDRNTINANLGFQNYYFMENLYSDLLGDVDATRKSDAVLFQEIVDLMKEADGPYFSLNVTFQNHGPFSTNYTGKAYLTRQECANSTIRSTTNHYLSLVETTNQALADMVEELRSMEEPVLLVVFGDHKPYLGDYTDFATNLEAFGELGINCDAADDEGFFNFYSTPYFIWANDAAKAELGSDCVGDGGDFGPYFLMNKVFDLCGWTGDAMMQASNKLLEAGITVVSSAVEVYYENGQLADDLSEAGQEALDTFLHFQKAWQKNFVYDDIAESNQQAREEAEEAAGAETQAAETAQSEAETESQAPSPAVSSAGNRSSRTYSSSGHNGGSANTGGTTPSESAQPSETVQPAETAVPSVDPTPAESPVPSTDPTPSENPTPSTDPTPSENPTPSTDPTPSEGGNTGGSTGSETTGGGTESGGGDTGASSGTDTGGGASAESTQSNTEVAE